MELLENDQLIKTYFPRKIWNDFDSLIDYLKNIQSVIAICLSKLIGVEEDIGQTKAFKR